MDELMKHELNALRAENERLKAIVEGLEKEINELGQKYDNLHRKHERTCRIQDILAREKKHELNALRAENERLKAIVEGLARENEELNAKKDNELAYYRIKQLEETNERLKSQLMETNDTLEKANRDRWDLQEQLDILKHKDVVFVDLDSSKLKGMEELWAMLGKMYAADPIEVSKIFGWFSINNIAHYTPDVKEFLKKYETWKSGKDEKEAERKPSEEVPCSFNWKLDGTEFTIETSIPRKDYDNIVKIISGKE